MVAVEYNAIAIGIAAIMFFLMEFGTRINFQTTGKGVIDVNTIAKTFYIFMSLVAGWGLVTFLVGIGNNNPSAIATVTNNMIRFWVLISGMTAIFFVVYLVAVVPKVAKGDGGGGSE